MKLEKPKDVFLYLSKYLHCYNLSNSENHKSYFICIVLKTLLDKGKIKSELYNDTSFKLINYLWCYGDKYGAFYSQDRQEYMFTYDQLKERKEFLKFIYELELKHENNTK
jgi:hypothetical protein